jgi:hypothetical protein
MWLSAENGACSVSLGVQARRAPDLASTLGAPRDTVDVVSRRVLHGDYDDVAFAHRVEEHVRKALEHDVASSGDVGVLRTSERHRGCTDDGFFERRHHPRRELPTEDRRLDVPVVTERLPKIVARVR